VAAHECVVPSILVSDAVSQSKSPASKLKISRSPQEPSLLENGADVQSELTGSAQPKSADGPIGFSHRPLLSSVSHEPCQRQSAAPVNAAGQKYQCPRLPARGSSSDSAQTSPAVKERGFGDFLDNIRVTSEERRFLRNMLGILPTSDDNSVREAEDERPLESGVRRPLSSNQDPFLSEALNLVDDSFFAL
jgi:hypothetical protein